jgi:hypothetical protein
LPTPPDRPCGGRDGHLPRVRVEMGQPLPTAR